MTGNSLALHRALLARLVAIGLLVLLMVQIVPGALLPPLLIPLAWLAMRHSDLPLQFGLTAGASVLFWQTVSVNMIEYTRDSGVGSLLSVPMAMAFGLVFYSTSCGRPLYTVSLNDGGTLD